VLDEIRERQAGALSRKQALACGLTDEAIEARLRDRWQRVFGSIYVTHNGPLHRDCLMWAAVLRAGSGAVLSYQSAGELAGLVDDPDPRIHVTVPSDRRVAPIRGVAIHYSNRLAAARHPLRLPPQTRVEETVVDLTQTCDRLGDALGWITRAGGRRLTRPERIALAIDARKKVRWREELLSALTDVDSGAQSPLELKYLRDVEHAHDLPSGSRQQRTGRPGRRTYDDVRYTAFGVVVELDGRAAHPDEARWRDMSRDNASAVEGRRVLRYGWGDVVGQPCAVAAQVAEVLQASGWLGTPRPCGPGCVLLP